MFLICYISEPVSRYLKRIECDMTVSEFLSQQHFAGYTNMDAIKSKYSKLLLEKDKDFNEADPVIKEGTSVFVLPTRFRRETFSNKHAPLSDVSEQKAFIASRLEGLMNDFGKTTTFGNDGSVLNREEFLFCKCLIWSRISGKLIDISSHVIAANTSINANGGSFSLNVRHFNAEETENQKFINTENFRYSNIMENDLVYLKLGIDAGDERKTRAGDYVWDMIGLVDEAEFSYSPNDVYMNISGRDLMKVFIEDGSLFSPGQFLAGVWQKLETSTLAARNVFSLIEQVLLTKMMTFTKLKNVLQYIFDKFSNIGIIPDHFILEQYGTSAALNSTRFLDLPDGYSAVEQSRKLQSKILRSRNGLWRIMNLLIEPEAGERTIFDPSLCADNGSVINSIRSLCAPPFAEFYGDTYGSQYYCTVRKQPFDLKGMTSLVYGNPVTELGIAQKVEETLPNRTLSNLTIDIDESQVLSCSLNWHKEVYTWYTLSPTCMPTLNDKMKGVYVPLVLLDEYAEIWGNRPYSAEHDYIIFKTKQQSNTEKYNSAAFQQLFADLRFLIQSHAYLPFTRTGSMILTLNRAIKRGLFIYYKTTNEVYYVESVSHNASINDSYTSINVSRGMVLPYITGRKEFIADPNSEINDQAERVSPIARGKEQVMSYFNLVDMPSTITSKGTDSLANWRVNKDVFNFFLKRRQMIEQ